jgi:hypothetical protein
MTSPVQLQEITTQLSTYFSRLQLYLNNPTNTPPSFEDFVELLNYEDVLTDALRGENRTASFVTGALADVVHIVIAIKREFNMRVKTKALYYVDGETDAAQVDDFYTALYAEYINFFRGAAPEQVM